MGKVTDISWTDSSWSPWWGCQKVSTGCRFCYADSLSKRFGHNVWGPPEATSRRLFGQKHWQQPIAWNVAATLLNERRRVFPSMCDPFELHPQLTEPREHFWQLIRDTPNLDWLLLTKRPENIEALLPSGFWSNIWLGVSTEDQVQADLRIPKLLNFWNRVPVLFLSVEPQLGPIDLLSHRYRAPEPFHSRLPSGYASAFCFGYGVNWVIQGGESGPHHRPFENDWAVEMRWQCQAAGIPFWFKQHGGRTPNEGGCLIDGRECKQLPSPRFGVRDVVIQ